MFYCLMKSTNNLDLETCNHVMQVLRAYPGAIIIISHDMDFLKSVGVDEIFDIEKFKVKSYVRTSL